MAMTADSACLCRGIQERGATGFISGRLLRFGDVKVGQTDSRMSWTFLFPFANEKRSGIVGSEPVSLLI
ncbi:hypothetical protein GOB93_14435 [Acetobacter musti]|uniref:Uncharacterized protein n=1 Tax=Acetobacter musti TaxID=864732 RepID=A0ABX0JS38_9PROT|nr:hypothetical protein [Acetobacter musti]NHN85830.1 hypothetical protein [Acetobacter musti]